MPAGRFAVSRHHIAAIGLVAGLLTGTARASAQGVRCSAFLHERDGSWRSFEPGIILLPRGPVRVITGERFRRGAPSAKDYIAHLLDQDCQPLD
jgi:hypothetical protein